MYTQNQIKILTVLINQPTKEYYLSELSQIFGKQPGIFQKGLNSLELEGIIKSRRDGKNMTAKTAEAVLYLFFGFILFTMINHGVNSNARIIDHVEHNKYIF